MTDQLSPMEAIMWRVGQDASLRMTIGALIILERPPTRAALIERLASAAAQAPRMHRRLDDPVAIRGRASWTDDPDSAPEHHLRSLSVARPGSMRQLLDLVGVLESVPFDPERSPWDLTLIEGLEKGRAAAYLRAHHVLTDGVGGIRLLGLLLDELPSPPPAIPSESPRMTEGQPAGNGDRPLGTVTVTIDFPKVLQRFADRVSAARSIDPVDSAVRGVQRALDVANSVSRQLIVTDGPLSSWPASRSLLSRFDVISVEHARATALALGGSRNDLLVAATAAALGHYHEQLGHATPALRLATPAAQRRDREMGGNWFAPARLEVPTSLGRPGPQFGVVRERLAQARREPALQVASTLAATLGRMPTRILLPALRAQAESIDFAATALPGLRGERHLCGSRIEASYPLGPRLGCPMNVTAFGTDGRLDVGIALDPVAFTQPDLLVKCLREAFDGLVTAAADGSAEQSD